MAYLTLNCVMRQILKPALIFSFIIFTLFTANAQQIEFLQNKNSAGKASLTSDAYYSSFTLGTANFSPELRLLVQIFYDSAIKDEGLAGVGWKIPQLESSACRPKTAPFGLLRGERKYHSIRVKILREIY